MQSTPLSNLSLSLSVVGSSSVNKGIGVDNYHYLNDGLWTLKPMK